MKKIILILMIILTMFSCASAPKNVNEEEIETIVEVKEDWIWDWLEDTNTLIDVNKICINNIKLAKSLIAKIENTLLDGYVKNLEQYIYNFEVTSAITDEVQNRRSKISSFETEEQQYKHFLEWNEVVEDINNKFPSINKNFKDLTEKIGYELFILSYCY